MITKPTLLLDENKCRQNIRAMAAKAQKNRVAFRPHFKTHQSLEIGRWFKAAGVDRITVSSFEMARYFSSEWYDITVAFPVNILEIDSINALAKDVQLNLLIESTETAKFLIDHLKFKTGFFIKIDVGTGRTGILPGETDKIDEILRCVAESENLHFKGFLAHAGHTYQCRSEQEIRKVFDASVNKMTDLKQRYLEKYPDLIISVGDTPGCSTVDNLSGVDEIRPGNFVFYDLVQQQIGSCSVDKIAVAMACPVVAIHENRNEIVVYGGGVHLSKDIMRDDELGTIFGRVAEKKIMAGVM
jgi:D-serine deaminase-like pyridoxal phosphate-dependent protein